MYKRVGPWEIELTKKREEIKEGEVKIMNQANTIPLLTSYQMGRFNLSHKLINSLSHAHNQSFFFFQFLT